MLNKILFFGNERLATGLATEAPTLRALVAEGYEITGVVVAQNQIGKSRQTRELEIVQVANEYKIPVLAPANLNQIGNDLAAINAEAAVLVAYGKIIPQSVIDTFPMGVINIHPSLLPKHRGPTPIESVILDNDSKTGVSLMKLTNKMDAGPIYAQESIDLKGNETKQALADNLQQIGAEMLIKHLPGILDGSLKPAEQDHNLASYDQLINKNDGLLDFHKTGQRLAREVRAYSGWPRSRTTINKTDVVVTKAHYEHSTGSAGEVWHDNHNLGIYCSVGSLIIDRLIPAGKKEMSAQSFLSGYKLK